MGAPAIADAEINRLRPPEQFGIGLLEPARELADRSEVAAEREEAPLLRIVISQRHAGIILDDGGAVGEDVVAHGGEIAGVQQIRRALDQAVARRKTGTEFQKTAGLDAAVGEIGRE